MFAERAARSGPPIVVTLWSQILGFLIGCPLLIVVLRSMTGKAAVHGAIAGLGSGVSLLLLYSSSRHLYVGVSSALSAVVPCVIPVGVAASRQAVTVQEAVGVALCVLALAAVGFWHADATVVLPSGPGADLALSASGPSPRPVPKLFGLSPAIGSGVAMSVYYISLAGLSPHLQLGEALESRSVAAVVLIGVAMVIGRGAIAPGRSALRAALPVRAFGIAGALCYAAAVTDKNLGVIVPIVTMSPVVTVVVAWLALHERISRRQIAALLIAMVGAALVSS